MADDDGADDVLTTYLKAISHPKRLRILRLLAQPHTMEEIASELGVARQTAQDHVQQLYDAGLVVRMEGEGTTKPAFDYVVMPQRMFNLYEMIGELSEIKPDVDERAEVRYATESFREGATRGPADPDLPRLSIVHGLRIGQTLTLAGEGPWLLGRDPSSAIPLEYDPFASNRHAEIQRAPGGFTLTDLHSRNGTSLDWRTVAKGSTVKLENGSLVRIGKTLMLFRRSA